MYGLKRLVVMKTEQLHAFEIEVEYNLSKKQFVTVLESLKKPENGAYIEANLWNLISTVCLTLKTKDLLQTEQDLEICRKILMHLVDRGKPKEVIVALMEDADTFKSHAHFCLLLDPLKHTLRKVPGKRGKSLEWVLGTLNAHIQTLPLPEDLDLQGEEKLLLDTDPAVVDTNYVLTHYLQFLDTFVNEVSHEGVSIREDYYMDRILNQREILQKFILILLNHPLLYHDLHVELGSTRPKSTIRTLCESFINRLSKICCDVFILYRFDTSCSSTKMDTNDDSEHVPSLAFSNLSYLIFVEKITVDFQPFVYNHKYLFIMNLNYINLLLSKKENLVLVKGLQLAHVLLNRLEEFEIAYEYVELTQFTELPKLLLQVAVFSKFEVHRKVAVRVFLSCVSKCDWKSRYHLISQVLCTSGHSGVEGLVIHLYQTYLHGHLNSSDAADSYFLGTNLRVFMEKVFLLKNGVETDLLQQSDRIISSLNFLRYLLLRDGRDQNVTGVWNMLADISEHFLEPLRMGLDLSRAHYKQFAKDHESERRARRRAVHFTVTVDNEVLPNVPPDFEKDVYDRAFLTFDMIESILSRVRELL